MTTLTHAEVLARLRAHILQEYGSQAVAARAWGVSRSQVCHVLAGRNPPSDPMLRDIGVNLWRNIRGQFRYEPFIDIGVI